MQVLQNVNTLGRRLELDKPICMNDLIDDLKYVTDSINGLKRLSDKYHFYISFNKVEELTEKLSLVLGTEIVKKHG